MQNERLVHSDCSKRRNEKILNDINRAAQAIESKITHEGEAFVQFKFEQEGTRSEYMWVKVTSINEINYDLTGTLDNDPLSITNVKCGDTIKRNLNEALQILGTPFSAIRDV